MAMEGIFVSGTSQLLKKLICVVDDLLANGGTDHQLKILKKTLEDIEAVTCDAERKQVNDAAVKLWLIKLKEAAYDVDDELDRLFYEAVVCGFKRNSSVVMNPLAGLSISLNSNIILELDRLSNEMFKFGLQQTSIISNIPPRSSKLNDNDNVYRPFYPPEIRLPQKRLPISHSSLFEVEENPYIIDDVDNQLLQQKEDYKLEYSSELELRYDFGDLSSHLKQCFSYFSLFPKDWRFNGKTLIQMWMAEGFLDQPSDGGNHKSVEDIGHEYYTNLKRSSYCEIFERGEQGVFTLNHSVHDIAQSVAGRHEVTVLRASEMQNSNVSEIRRLQLVFDEGKQDISTILLRERKLRTIFCNCCSISRLEIDCLHLRLIHLAGISQLSIFSPKHLRYLHLTDCEIVKIDMDNCKFQLLQTLNLSKCRNVHMILKEIESLEMLKHLTISCSEVKVLPESIFTLLNLQTLDISRCDINILPGSVGSLQNLFSLDISHTPITELPDSITSISSLGKLEFHHCHNLKALPISVGSLQNLLSLDVSHTPITELPDSITSISSLERLEFHHCHNLKALPINLGALTQLRSLDVEGTGVTELPESLVRNLWKLSSVNINRLEVLVPYRTTNFGGISGLGGLNSLRVLEITHLENVKGIVEAGSARLRYKQHLRELCLKWEEEEEEEDDYNYSVMALEGLKPHRDLEKLVMENFGGVKLPKWMDPSSIYFLLNLVELYLSNCNRCENLPALGMLPCLEVLWIYGARSIKRLGQEFYYPGEQGTSTSTKARPVAILFPSLNRLDLGELDNIEEWHDPPPPYISFPVLETVCIIGCCELTSIPDFRSCVSLWELIIEECNKLESTFYDFIQREDLSDDSSEKYQSPTSNASNRYLVKEITSGTAAHSAIQDIAALETEEFLHIRNLENVRGGKEGAERSMLKDKQHIEDLYLSWDSSSFYNDDEFIDRTVNDGMVLEGLQPHPNLKMLTISGFMGLNLPNWMGSRHSLPNLVKLYLENCNTCHQLPALGMLPSLKILQIEGMSSVMSLGQEFYYLQRESNGSSSNGEIKEEEINSQVSVFPSLEELSLIDMPILEDWAAPDRSFKSLKKLIISGCLRLKSIPFGSCSSLQSLELCHTNDEVVNLIFASKGGDQMSFLPSVSIQYSPQLKYFPVWLLPNDIRIQSLEIAQCPNYQGFYILDNDEFHAQVSPDTGFTTSISSLCSLKLFDCPALTSVPDLREWTSLTNLWIEDCDKLKDSFSYDLASLPSLKTLYVDRPIDLHRE